MASQTFEGHEDSVFAAVVFPDRCRMVTASGDKTLRLWDLEDGVVLKIMEGHRNAVYKTAISTDAQFIASGDKDGKLIAWNKDASTELASGSFDATAVLWNTETWEVHGDTINCGPGAEICCARYSPSGEHLAIATNKDIQIWNSGKRECIAKFEGHTAFNGAWNTSLVWTPDGKQLVSAGSNSDPTIRIWDSSTWMQVGGPWKGHTKTVFTIALNPTGTILASASKDHQVRLWRLSDQRTIAIFKHTDEVFCVTFSTDGKHILSGGKDAMISKWAVPSLEDILKDQESDVVSREDAPKEQAADNVQQSDCDILTINTIARDACISGDLLTADKLLTQDIGTDGKDYNSYMFTVNPWLFFKFPILSLMRLGALWLHTNEMTGR